MIGQSPPTPFELDQTHDPSGRATTDLEPGVRRSNRPHRRCGGGSGGAQEPGCRSGRGRGRGGVRPGTVDDPDNLISYAALHLRRRSRRRFFALRRCRRLPQPRQLSSIRSRRQTALDPAGACVADTCQTAICEFSYVPLGIRSPSQYGPPGYERERTNTLSDDVFLSSHGAHGTYPGRPTARITNLPQRVVP